MLNALLDGVTGVLGVIMTVVVIPTEYMYIISSITHGVLPDGALVAVAEVAVHKENNH